MDFLQDLSLDHEGKAIEKTSKPGAGGGGTRPLVAVSASSDGLPPKREHGHIADKLFHLGTSDPAAKPNIPSSSSPQLQTGHVKHDNVLDKLSSAFGTQEAKSASPQSMTAPALSSNEPVKHEHLFDKLSSAFSGNQAQLQPDPVPASAHPEETKKLADRVAHAFGVTHDQPPPPPLPPSKPEPEGLLGKLEGALGFQPAHTSPPPPPPPPPKPEGILDKLGGALGFETAHTPSAPPVPVPVAEPAKHEGLAHKISGVFDFDGSKRRREEEEEAGRIQEMKTAEEERKKHEHHHVGDVIEKLGLATHQEVEPKAKVEVVPPKQSEESLLDRFGFGHHESQEAKLQPAAVKEHGLAGKIEAVLHKKKVGEELPKQPETLVDKIESAIHQHKEDPPPKKPETLADKIKSAVHHHHEEPPKQPETLADKIEAVVHHRKEEPPKPETLVDKFESVVHHHKEEPPRPEILADKLSSALGLGGAEKKKKEDGLDKTIDFVQEHVLHEGSQKNESYIEKLKDEQIAKAVRAEYKYVTGHEFPIKEKEKHHHDWH